MSFFDSIPVRSNGDDILAAWFNTIRTFLINYTDSVGITTYTPFASATSQTDTDVTGLIFDKTLVESSTIQYTIKTATKFEKGNFNVIFRRSHR